MATVKLTDICDAAFFTAMGSAISGTAGAYIESNKTALVMHIIVNYSGLLSVDSFSTSTTSQAGDYVGRMYAVSLQKIFDALNKQYDPLANTDVVETEEKDGQDKNTRGGTDTSTVVSSLSTHSATTFDSSTQNPTGQTSSSGTSTMGYGRTDTLEYDTTITRRKSGNIGVMSTQELLGKEYDIRIRRTFFEAITTCIVVSLSLGLWESDE